jgi:hypothetical protein
MILFLSFFGMILVFCKSSNVGKMVLLLFLLLMVQFLCVQFAHIFYVVPTSTKRRFVVHGFRSRRSIIDFDDRF